MRTPEHLPDWPLALINQRLSSDFHGDYRKWHEAVGSLPDQSCTLQTGATVHLEMPGADDLAHNLRQLHPWRKGPFQFANVFIDTEWRSDWKWQRIQPYLDLNGHRVLDVGCGNGYFGWRMLQAGASEVIGIDPTILFCMQHQAVQRFVNHPSHWVLPLGIEDIPHHALFDSVFSMGVIYHRRSPLQHIEHLKDLLLPHGQLILESIITQDNQGFRPNRRYARMRNVWWIPTVAEMTEWLKAAGFRNVQCLDVSSTSTDEQRSTDWMTFESLAQSLSPENRQKTVEGYPAPKRAVMLAST